MVLPVGSNVNEVDVRTLAKLLITFLAIVDGSRSEAILAQTLVLLSGTLFLKVAEGYNCCLLYTSDAADE